MNDPNVTAIDLPTAELALLDVCVKLAPELARLAAGEHEPDLWTAKAAEVAEAVLGVLGARLQREPENARLWELHGATVAHLGRLDEALDDYRRVLAIDPRRVTALRASAHVLTLTGRLNEALAICELGLKIEPGNSVLWAGRGRALDRLGRLEEAVHSYEQASLHQPERASHWAASAKLLDELGRFDEALQYYDRALNLRPTSTPYWKRKARILQKLGRADEARGAAQAASLLRQARQA